MLGRPVHEKLLGDILAVLLVKNASLRSISRELGIYMEGAPINEPTKETPKVLIRRMEDELDVAITMDDHDSGRGMANNPEIRECLESLRRQLAQLKETLNPSETES